MSDKRETLDLADLPPKVRTSLEHYLQHREQMRGERFCTGISLSEVTVAYTVQRGGRRWDRGAESPDDTPASELHPHDPDYESPARSGDANVGWECSRPLFPPEDDDPTPWGV